MGFFSKLLAKVAPTIGGFLAGGPLGAVAGFAGGTIARQLSSPQIGGGAQRGVKLAGETAAQTILRQVKARPSGATARALGVETLPTAGIVPGGLKNKVITRVQTLDPAGNLLREVVLDGRPFLMRKDFVTLKRTLKLISVAEKRVPRARRRGQADRDELNTLQGLVKGLIAAGDSTARALTVIDTD